MLSSQTKDPVTSAAVTSLHNNIPGGLTALSLSVAPIPLIEECINKVGFWRRKAEYISEAAKRIVEEGKELDEGEEGWEDEVAEGEKEWEEGDIPRTLGGLCKLKGVGELVNSSREKGSAPFGDHPFKAKEAVPLDETFTHVFAGG